MKWTDELVLDFVKVSMRGAYGQYEGLHSVKEKLAKFKLLHSIPPGAAQYFANGLDVVMYESTFDLGSVIDSAKTETDARKLADKWQMRENKAVNKALKVDRKHDKTKAI